MEVINIITVDLARPGVKPMISVMQGDENARVLEVTINANGIAWEIPAGVNFSMAYKKPDGTKGLYDTMPDGSNASSVDGSVVSIRLAPQMLTTPGTVSASVVISNGDQRISTFPIIVNVIQNPAVGAVGSEDYFYSSAIGNLDDLKTTDKSSVVAAINEIFSTGGGSDSGQNPTVSTVEPAEDDIPKVFFGGALQQTKTEAVVPFRYISKTDDFSGYAEIKAQGNSSMNYPKKNQTVKMFADEACESKMKKDFKGWGKQNKHVYKANWIDLSHARNVVSARLWADVVKSRANYAALPELLRTAPNQGAVDGFPVKVYAAGVYQGRYTLNIPKDKWTFNMDDDLEEHCVLYSENYVSGCFRASASINGNDWTDEIHDSVPASIKTRWNQVISFVMNSTDEDFRENLNQYFFVDSLIDYYLFGLASCGLDAFGKNQIYATYDGQRWIASMYDMDSTWGLYWNGSKFVATDYARTSYEDYINTDGNLLYNRLEQLFWSELQTRWAELKSGALSIENIINRFERFTDIAPAELVKEDYASTTGGGKFTGIPSQTTNNIQQIRAYALARQAWTNEYVAALTPEVEVPCTGISLNTNTLTFTAEGTQTLIATVTPEGCTDPVFWESNNPSVATVENGVVTAVANGGASITARCGGYSASCTVSVSGIVEPVPCTGITLDKTELSITEDGAQTIVATVTPSDTTDKIVWSSENEDVATVENGEVVPIGNGSAVITASCGSYSASCTVTVDLPILMLYSMPEAKTFNGTSDYIDTGIQLFNVEKNATIIVCADFTNKGNGGRLLYCMKEEYPYPGISLDGAQNLRVMYGNGTNYSRPSVAEYAEVHAVALRITNGRLDSFRYVKKNGEILSLTVNGGFTAIENNLLIGCMENTSGAKSSYWKGLVSVCDVYAAALDEATIDAKLLAL